MVQLLVSSLSFAAEYTKSCCWQIWQLLPNAIHESSPLPPLPFMTWLISICSLYLLKAIILLFLPPFLLSPLLILLMAHGHQRSASPVQKHNWISFDHGLPSLKCCVEFWCFISKLRRNAHLSRDLFLSVKNYSVKTVPFLFSLKIIRFKRACSRTLENVNEAFLF